MNNKTSLLGNKLVHTPLFWNRKSHEYVLGSEYSEKCITLIVYMSETINETRLSYHFEEN